MQKLIESGLFGRGLITIDQAHLVDQYNKCLEAIGLKQTKLQTFRIDGMGWSPEIAAEQQNEYYLSHSGVANPYAIILSPLQENRPIYFPFHSFDRDMMRIVFHSCRDYIQDITTQTAIWIDIDQEISNYRNPQDLLMIDSITLRFYTIGGIMEKAREQRKMVQTFYEEEHTWGDENLINNLLKSAKENGDLRFRSLDIPNVPYNHIRSFYTRAFGGLFIFRYKPNTQPLLIFETQKTGFSGDEEYGHVEYELSDYDLLNKLYNEALITFDINLYKRDVSHLERIQEHFFVDAYTKQFPGNEIIMDNDPHRKKKIIQLMQTGLNEAYFELEKLIKRIKNGELIYMNSSANYMRLVLAQPNPELDSMTQLTVWKLLVKLYPKDILWLYSYDKEQFFDEYLSWSEPKQNWAIKYLKKYYIPSYNE